MVVCKICTKEFEDIKELSKHLVKEHEFTAQKIYDYYGFSFETGEAICPICGKDFVMTKRQIHGFKKNPNKSIGCCTSCSKALIIVTHGSPLANPETYQKTKESLMKNHGVEHPAQAKEVMEKMKKTNLERRGVENSFLSKEVQEKKKKTNLERYGVEQSIGCKKIREKAQETLMKSYGVDNAFKSEEIKDKIKKKNLENFGVEHAMQSKEVQEKMKKTNLERRGVEFPLQSEESMKNMKKTNLERRGVEYTFQSKLVQEKKKETMLERYGVEFAFQSPKIQERMRKNNLEKRGVEYVLQDREVREKGKATNKERYGVEYFCQHEDCYKNNYSRISKVNKRFQEFLNENFIGSELEFVIENSGYDLKVGSTLIEIDPWFTHNSTVAPTFGKKVGKIRPSNYHAEKTNFAKEHGYNCIHVFDWDDLNKIMNLLQPKERIYARECEVKEINKKVAKEFLESYHLQGSTREVKFACGLFYKGELVEVMTFGKPRYNKNYEYELLRLCTASAVFVVGGAGKLLNFFVRQVKPKSLISYCDLSKFNGEVYEKLGFKLEDRTLPAKHWYHPKTKRHITDNLLRQRGYDQLHGASFGKGTSNEELMIKDGYVEIYDCGQLVFVKEF